MRNHRPSHVWDELDDVTFLYKRGAIGRSEDEIMHPTAAGLLMFGFEYEIVIQTDRRVIRQNRKLGLGHLSPCKDEDQGGAAMSKQSKIVEYLLPLYRDGVYSEESRELIDVAKAMWPFIA